jgi:DNA-binding response OmpR family regulator
MTKPLAIVIEDDPQLSQIFMLTLNELYETEAITDGAQALVRLSEVVPHLVVLDINLPGASGTQILSVIRADSRYDATRVILATANSHIANELREKADIVLLKPVSVGQLRDLAERLK